MYRTTLPFLFPGVMNILYIFQVLQAPTKSQVAFYFQQGSVDWSPIEKKCVMLEVFLEYFFDAEDRHSTFSLRVQQTRGCVLPGFFAFISIQLLTHIDTEEEWTLCWWILDQVSLDTGRGCLAPTHPGICSFAPSVARCRNLLRLHCFVQEGWVGGQATCTLGQGTWSKTLSFSLNSCQSCAVLKCASQTHVSIQSVQGGGLSCSGGNSTTQGAVRLHKLLQCRLTGLLLVCCLFVCCLFVCLFVVCMNNEQAWETDWLSGSTTFAQQWAFLPSRERGGG